MTHSWEQKVIIITGASSGIGKALAIALSPQSPKLVLAARDGAQLENVAHACECLGASTLVVPTDVTDPYGCSELIQRAREKFSRIDVLVNNAGMSMWATVEDVEDVSQFRQLMDVNFMGSVYCTKFALPYLKEARGQVVAISSVTSFTGIPSHAIYCASKHAMNGFFEALRIELAHTGVHVTIVAPDFVKTEIFERSVGADGRRLCLHLPKYDSFLSAEACADIIVQAMTKRKRLVITSLRGKVGRWVKLCWPKAIDWIAQRGVDEALI